MAESPMKESQRREAGRQLDAEVAERVMGWTNLRSFDDEDGVRQWQGVPPDDTHLGQFARANFVCYGWCWLPRYSSRIEDAMRAVDRMKERGWAFSLRSVATWTAAFEGQDSAGEDYWSADADTASLAICRAALMLAEATV